MNENNEMAAIGRGSEPGESENPFEESGPVCGLPAERIPGLSRAAPAAHSENFAPNVVVQASRLPASRRQPGRPHHNGFRPRCDCPEAESLHHKYSIDSIRPPARLFPVV